QFISRAGDALQGIASLWLVLDLTHNNPLAAGVSGAFEFLPFILFGLIGGVLVDRWERRRLMAIVDTIRGLLLLIIPILSAAGSLHVWEVIALTFCLTSLGRLFTPALQALLPDLVPTDQLTRANAVSQGSNQAAFTGGPAIGGVLLAVSGAANLF